jgi:hypothetical protein
MRQREMYSGIMNGPAPNIPQDNASAVVGPATPSNSTSASALGAALAVILVWVLSLRGVTMPIGVEAAFGGLLSTLAGYLPRSGRQ